MARWATAKLVGLPAPPSTEVERAVSGKAIPSMSPTKRCQLPSSAESMAGDTVSGGECNTSGYYTMDEGMSGDESSSSAVMHEIFHGVAESPGGSRSLLPESGSNGSGKRSAGISEGGIASGQLDPYSFSLEWGTEAPRAEKATKEEQVCGEPPSHIFKVRGPTYLTDRIKLPSEYHAMNLLGTDLIHREERIVHAGQTIAKAKLAHLKESHGEDIFLVNFQLPGKPGHLSLLLWFGLNPRAKSDECFYPLWQEFRDTESDAFRNMRLKLMVMIPDGPFLLRRSVPSNKPVILGKGIQIGWARADGYLEAEVDIASSTSAEKMWGLVQSVVQSIVVDLALVIEAKEVQQLPERLLGVVRIQRCDIGFACKQADQKARR